jgi:hypothetical protein
MALLSTCCQLYQIPSRYVKQDRSAHRKPGPYRRKVCFLEPAADKTDPGSMPIEGIDNGS